MLEGGLEAWVHGKSLPREGLPGVDPKFTGSGRGPGHAVGLEDRVLAGEHGLLDPLLRPQVRARAWVSPHGVSKSGL